MPEPIAPGTWRAIERTLCWLPLVLGAGNAAALLSPEVLRAPYVLFLAFNLPAHLCVVLVNLAALRWAQTERAHRSVILTSIALLQWTAVVSLSLDFGAVIGLNVAFTALMIMFARVLLDSRVGLFAIVSAQLLGAAFWGSGLLGLVGRIHFLSSVPPVARRPGELALYWMWCALFNTLAWLLSSYAANRFHVAHAVVLERAAGRRTGADALVQAGHGRLTGTELAGNYRLRKLLGRGGMEGDKFGKYRIVGYIGRGGMGAVLRAHDPTLDREVALKMLDGGGDSSAEGHKRMLREARAAAAINHPNAVSVFEVGEVDGVSYLAMELIEGRSLRAYVTDQEAATVAQRLTWMLGAARALSAAHARGIVHRDVKPENVMVRHDGVVKVLDFGIARRSPTAADPRADSVGLTQPGMLVGTPCYMAPEQVRGEALDGRTDQFAWGVVVFELLTGKLPWGAHDKPLRAIAEMGMRPAPKLDIDACAAVVRRALEVKRDARFASMEALIAELEPAVAALPRGAARPSRPSGETAAVALATTAQVSLAPPGMPDTLASPVVADPQPIGTPKPMPGCIGGKYRVVRPLARGGMGAVYEVEHAHTGERCALKVLGGVVAYDPVSIERFKLEARVSSRIKSEHIVRILDADLAPELGGRFFLVMELLDGETLAGIAGSDPQNPERVVAWMRDVARGLEGAHREGIVHRDLKPSNLFLTRRPDGSPVVKILDFGLAKMADVSQSRTVEGAIVGTPLYMAPEQADGGGRAISHYADIWAIGVMAFRFLRGRDYFEAATLSELLSMVLYAEIEPPSARGLDLGPAFDAWFARSCSREPSDRYPSIRAQTAALAQALGTEVKGAVSESEKPPATPSRPAPVAAAGEGSLRGASTDARAEPPGLRAWPIAVGIAAIGAIGVAMVVSQSGAPRSDDVAVSVASPAQVSSADASDGAARAP